MQPHPARETLVASASHMRRGKIGAGAGCRDPTHQIWGFDLQLRLSAPTVFAHTSVYDCCSPRLMLKPEVWYRGMTGGWPGSMYGISKL